MKSFRLDSLPVLTALVIGGTILLLVFLIPDQRRVLERAFRDKDFPRIEKILAEAKAKSPGEKQPLHDLLIAWLDLNKALAASAGGKLDRASTSRLAGPFLVLLKDKDEVRSALEGLAEILAHSESAGEIESISSMLATAISPEQETGLWRMVKSSAKAAGNPIGEAFAVQSLSNDSAQTTLRLATLWQEASLPLKAVETVKGWLDRHPLSAEAAPLVSLYIKMLRTENRNGEALEFLMAHRDSLEKILPGSEAAEMMALTALAAGKSAEVLPALYDWLKRNPDDGKIWLQLSEIAMGAGDQKLAAEALENVLRLHPDDNTKKWLYAKALEWSGQPGAAFDAYLPLAAAGSRPALDRLIALAPGLHREADLSPVLPKFLPPTGTSPDLLTLASLLVLEGKYDQARTLYLRHLAVKPDDLAVIESLAEIDMEDQLYDKARDLYLRAQKLDPESTGIAHNLVQLDWREGRYEGVLERLRSLAEQTKDPGIIQEFYSAAESLGDIPALVEAMELKIVYDPETPADTYKNLAYHYTLLGRTGEAEHALARGKERFSQSPFFREELASRLAADGKISGALKELEGQVGPDSRRELKSLYAFLLANVGRTTDALKFLKEGFSDEEKNDVEVLDLTGNLLEAAGKFREAESVYRDALKVVPGRLEFQLALARSLGAQGRAREMQVVLSGIDLALHPGASRDAAQVYLDIENYREASAILRRYLASAAGSGDMLAWRMLGDATLSQGDPERAKRAYRRSLQLVLKESKTL